TNIRQTAYIETNSEEPVYLDLSVEADEDKRYKVGVGDYSEEFTGEELDNLVAGPINLPENEVVPIDITLADPSHKNEEMEMTFNKNAIKLDRTFRRYRFK